MTGAPFRSAQDVAASRRNAAPTSMFLRMLVRAAWLRRGRALAALWAMIVAAAVATAMLNLYQDVQVKLGREFRNYGANIMVVGKDGASLPTSAVTQVESVLRGRGLASPFALIVGRRNDGQPLVVAGVDFDRVRQLDRWWSVSAWPSRPGQALIGIRATPEIAPQGQSFDLTFRGRSIHLAPAGTVRTGAAEDSRIFISLSDLVAWTGVQLSTIEVAAYGSPQEIAGIMSELSQSLPVAEVRPVRQIVEGEARVLGKTRSTLLAATALIILTAALCVLSTLMGWVFARLLHGFFAAEAAVVGAGGAVIGFAAGIGIAAWIGRVNFHAAVTPRFSILPMVMAGSIVVTLLSAIVPISSLRRIQPAAILRGE